MVLPEEGATLPANHTTIGIQGCLERSSLAFSVERDGTSMPVEFDEEEPTADWPFMGETLNVKLLWTRLILRSQLHAGDTLVLRLESNYDRDAGLQEVEVRWPVGEEEELPAQLGTLDVRKDHGVIRVAANSSCARDMNSSYADISLKASDDAEAWLARLRYELRIDDVPWMFFNSVQALYTTGAWRSSLGRGQDRVVLGCEVDPHRPLIHHNYLMPQALEPGPHRVRMVGFLASGEELSSEEVVVDLQCHPDSARALKAELDAYKEGRIGSESSGLEADSGDGCSIAAPGRARASGSLLWVLAILCFARAGHITARARRWYRLRSKERVPARR